MKYKCFLFLFFTFFNSFSQNGNTSYQFLNFETSPRSVAMGGDLISIYDNDLLTVNLEDNFSLEEYDYVPGRVISFPSNLPHRGLGPSEKYPYIYRQSVVFRVQPF